MKFILYLGMLSTTAHLFLLIMSSFIYNFLVGTLLFVCCFWARLVAGCLKKLLTDFNETWAGWT